MNESKTPWFALNTPELGRPFQEFCIACSEKGVLDSKTKQLLMIVVASVFQSNGEVKRQIESAMQAGASREEIIEALLISTATAARSQLEMHKDVLLKQLAFVPNDRESEKTKGNSNADFE
ncbi:MAG: carboxymuconolactone decarboxylase family protein [Sedimentisphaerales bacterium]|nr:carboxymuconolactone decarboxylase family protein [Sedimentisphaerales bacterium]